MHNYENQEAYYEEFGLAEDIKCHKFLCKDILTTRKKEQMIENQEDFWAKIKLELI